MNVDSIWTDTIEDQVLGPHVSVLGGLAIIPGVQKGAQRFTAGSSGYFSQLKIYFGLPTDADEVLVEVFRGAEPEEEFMTSGTLLDVTIGARTIIFPQPWAYVSEGEILNVVITPISGASCKWKQGSFESPEFTAFHYTGTWDTILIDLAMTSYITYTDTVIHDVLKVKDDKRVMFNDYTFPRHDGNAGEVMITNGSGSISWSSPEALNVSVLQDNDQDTKIEVEAIPDEDIIRMKVAGQQKLTILSSGKVGMNTNAPLSDLDIRGDDNTNDGGELQLATPTMTNFIRMFGGRLGDRNPFIAFSDQDTFHFVTTTPTWQNFTRRFTIHPNGNIGIGTTQPNAKLQVASGAVLFTGPTGDLPAMPAEPPAIGPGTRMMWYPDKAAFRFGRVLSTEWNRDSIGSYSFAGGVGNKAKGIFSFVGSGEGGNYAIGSHSFVGNGRDNIASGDYAFIGAGHDHNATATGSFIGGGSTNSATGQYAAVTGGVGNMASGDYSFSGSGLALFARSYGESVFGTYVTDYVPMSSTSFHEADRLFVVGNGTSSSNRKDALTILKNGSIGVGTSSPEYRLHIEGSDTSSQHILSIQNNYSGTTHVRAIEAIANPANGYGIGGYFTGGSKGVQAIVNATGSVTSTLTGVDASVYGGSGGTRIGLHGKASGGTTNWAGYFGTGNVRVENDMYISGEIGLGVSPTSTKLKIEGNLSSTAHVMQVSASYIGNSHIRAIDAASIPAPGYGIGGHFAGGSGGLVGLASSGSSTGTCVGIDGTATGTAGTRIGVRGSATGGATNWAGYFSSGNVYITNELRIGSGALGGATGYKLAVDGKVIAEEVRVQLSGDWPDYVFKDEYALLPLGDVEQFIKKNGHLPGIPSATQVEHDGHHLGEIQIKLLEKIEELTLHLIQLQKQNEMLVKRISDLENSTQSAGQ